MKKSKIELVVEGICKDGKIRRNMADEEKFALHYDGQKCAIFYRPLSDMANKERMFAYIFGPLLSTFSNAMEENGTIASQREWYESLKLKFAQKPFFNPLTKRQEYRVIDFSSDSVLSVELLNFITAIVQYLEEVVGVEAPNSDEYKIQQKLGPSKRTFKTTSNG